MQKPKLIIRLGNLCAHREREQTAAIPTYWLYFSSKDNNRADSCFIVAVMMLLLMLHCFPMSGDVLHNCVLFTRNLSIQSLVWCTWADVVDSVFAFHCGKIGAKKQSGNAQAHSTQRHIQHVRNI